MPQHDHRALGVAGARLDSAKTHERQATLSRVLSRALVVGFAACAISVIVGLTPFSGSPSVFAGILALGAVGTGLALRPKGQRRRDPWTYLGVALLAFVGAGATIARIDYPTSWFLWTELLGLTAYPFAMVGVLELVGSAQPGRNADLLIEAGLTAGASGLGLWVLLLGRQTHGGHRPSAYAVVAIALVALDLGVVVSGSRLLSLQRVAPVAYRLLFSALLLMLGAHLAFALSAAGVLHETLPAVRLILVLAFACFGLAGIHPTAGRIADIDRLEIPAYSVRHFAVVSVCMFVVPTILAVHAVQHVSTSVAVAFGAALLELVTAGYVGTLLKDRSASEHRAEHDGLTGMPNAVLFADRVQRAVAQAKRSGGMVVVMYIDLDHFKHVNDSLGHPAGDDLLVQVGKGLSSRLREQDTVARLGGDEFAVLLPEVSDFDGAVVVAEKLTNLFATPFTLGSEKWTITPSIGIASYPTDGPEAKDLIARADMAMYRVKDNGRNGIEVFSATLHSRAQERSALEADFHNALDRNELVVFYQPKIDLRTGRIVGAEALVRWMHPQRGLLGPAAFVPLAEQTGQVVPMGEIVLYEACRQNQAWQAAGLPPISVAVNVSVRQFRHGIVDSTASILRHTRLDPAFLDVELTESAAADGLDLIAAALHELRSMGVRCHIDDFGTGYSAFSYLSLLPVDGLKIDKSFTDAMSTTAGASIVAAIISMAHSLKLKVIAEGVETEEQLRLLAGFHCDEIQGYLFGKPMPAAEFEELLRNGARAVMLTPPPATPPALTPATPPAAPPVTEPPRPLASLAS